MTDDVTINDDFDKYVTPATPAARPASRPQVDYRQLYKDVGTKYGIDPDLLYNQAKHESVNFNPNFVYGPGRSPKGAAGIAQFMPDTARQYGLKVQKGQDDRFNPTKAADAHGRLMKDLIDKYGDPSLALAAYNSGTNKTPEQAARAMQRIPETRSYVQKLAPQDDFDKYISAPGRQPAQPTAPQTEPDDDFEKYVTQSQQDVTRETSKTPQITSTVKEADTGTELPSGKIEPIQFTPDEKIAGPLNPTRLSEDIRLQGMKMPANHPDVLGKRLEVKFDHQPTQDEVNDSILEQLGKGYGSIGKQFQNETGASLTQNVAVEKQPDGSYIAHARPTQGFVNAVNAYAQGGRSAYEATLNSQTVGRAAASRDALNAMKQGEGVRQDILQGAGKSILGVEQSGQNLKDLVTGTAPQDDPKALEIARARQNIPGSTTWTGGLGAGALETAGTIAEAEALGGNLPLQQALENIQAGPEAAYKAGVLAAPLVAAGPIGKAIGADELSPLARQATLRTIAGTGLGGSALASGASPTEALKQGALGAAFPVGIRGEVERPTELGIENAPAVGVQGRGALDADRILAEREARVKPVTDAQGNVLLNADEVAQNPDAKPRIKLANSPTDEPAHLANFRDRASDGTFVEGAAKIPEEFKAENVAATEAPAEQLTEQSKLPVPQTPELTPAAAVAPSQPAEAATTQPVSATTATIPTEESTVAAPKPEPISDVEATGTQSSPEPSEASARPAPETEPPPSTTSARKAQLANDRAELDLPDLPQPERRSWKNALIEAQDEGLDKRANAIADGVIEQPRPLTDKETAGLTLRLQQIKNEHAQALAAVDSAKGDDLIEARQRATDLEKEFDKLSDAVKQSGTEKGRALASQKLTINQDFDLVSMLNRYKVKTGKEPSPEIRAQIETQSKRIADLESQLAKAEESGRAKSVADSVAQMDRESRRTRRQVSKKALDEQAAVIKSNIAAEFMRLKTQAGKNTTLSSQGLGLLDPDGVITKELAKYVRNRVQSGITDAAQIVDDAHALIKEFADGVTRRQIQEAISGYGKPIERRSDLEKQIIELRSQMKAELSQADVEAGIRSPRREGPTKGEARTSGIPLQGPKLREGVGAKEGPQLGERQGPTLREGVGKREGPELGPRQGPRFGLGTEGPRLSEGTGKKEGPRITEAPFVGPKETKAQIQSRYQKQISEIERRIREQDFAPKARRGPTVLDSETQKIQVNLERAKQDFQRKLREWEQSQRSRPEKIADLAVNWSRAAKLMYVSTLGKLGSAATGRMVMSPIENLLGEVPHRLMPNLSAKAATEGGGFSKAGEVAALWKSGRFRQVLAQLTKGSSDLDVLLGSKKSIDKEMSSPGLLGIPGRVHGALKEYPRQAEFDRAFVKVLKNYEGQGRDITRPDVQLAARMEAFNSAERARFQQRNFVSDTFNNAMGSLERQGLAGKYAAKAGRFIFPITRVPVNVVGETLNYTFGLPRAVIETAIRGGVKNLTPEQADNIMRAYKKGGVGLAVMTYAFLHPQQFGGYYQKGEKRDPNEPQPGEVMFFGHRIPKIFTHVPILEAAQFAATARRVMDRMTQQGKDDVALGGGLQAGKGLAEQVPFYETPARFFTGQEGPRGVAEIAGQQVQGQIPGFVQEAAKLTDKDKQGQPIPRQPQGGFAQRFGQTVEMGIPGLRQRVPVNETKMSAERKQSFQDRFMKGSITEKDLNKAVKNSELTQSEADSIVNQKDLSKEYNPRQLQLYKTPVLTVNKTSPALDRFERMAPTQRMEVQKIMQEKADSIMSSDALTDDQKRVFADRIRKAGLIVHGEPKKVSSFQSRFIRGPQQYV